MIDNRDAFPIEILRQMSFGQGHTDRRRASLPQRSGGHLDSRHMSDLGMARGSGVPLAKGLDVFDRHIVTGEMEYPIEQH